MAGRVLEKFLREVIGKNMVPVLCVFSFRRFLRMRGGVGGEGGLTGRMDHNKEWQAQLMEIVIC